MRFDVYVVFCDRALVGEAWERGEGEGEDGEICDGFRGRFGGFGGLRRHSG